MKKFSLILLILATSLLMSCGGGQKAVITKSGPSTKIYLGPNAIIYLGGKLPGITEETMKDPTIKAEDIAYKIASFSGSRIGLEEEDRRLTSAMPNYSPDKKKMLDDLNRKLQNGEIAGYRFIPGEITIYSEHGLEGGILLSSFEMH